MRCMCIRVSAGELSVGEAWWWDGVQHRIHERPSPSPSEDHIRGLAACTAGFHGDAPPYERATPEQRYLAHKKTPTPLGPSKDPRHRPTAGS